MPRAGVPARGGRITMRATRCVDRIVVLMDAQAGPRRVYSAGGSVDLGGKGPEVMR
jgi:hypothetical protein